MRKPIIAGNWKMYKTVSEAVAVAKELKDLVAGAGAEVVICPPFTALYAVKQALHNVDVKVGAQNLYWEKEGAFTGEISPNMLKELGCDYVIIGHSERRQYFGEIDATVNNKVKAALKEKLIPIVCVGETLEHRENRVTEKIVNEQVEAGLAGLTSEEVAGIVIAYEPVWAIGTGRTASADDANAVCSVIRKKIGELFGSQAANAIRIQYGGSVKPENIAELMDKSDIDGALVGGASLNPATFSNIVKYKA